MANIEVFADSLSHSAAGLCRHEAVRYNDSAHAAVLEDLRHTDYKRVVEINAARQSELAREQLRVFCPHDLGAHVGRICDDEVIRKRTRAFEQIGTCVRSY